MTSQGCPLDPMNKLSHVIHVHQLLKCSQNRLSECLKYNNIEINIIAQLLPKKEKDK